MEDLCYNVNTLTKYMFDALNCISSALKRLTVQYFALKQFILTFEMKHLKIKFFYHCIIFQ